MLDFDEANKVRNEEELPLDALNQYLSANGLEQIKTVKQFSGGYSNLTYLIEADSVSYVLRKPPKGAKDIKGGHDMAREFGILAALDKAGFKQIPKPLLLCEDESIIGSIFYVMERVKGSILRAADAKSFLKEDNSALFKTLSEAICLNQVALHNIDIYETGLANIGKPEAYVERQVKGWHKRYLASQTDDISGMITVANWLEANIPESAKATLVHNDYKYDNLILNPENPEEILAILDWEMCTVGDPLMDLGTTLAYWVEFKDADFGKAFNLSWLPGNLTRQEYVDLYAAKSGRDVSNILFYYVFGLFKNAVIIQQIYARYKKGLTKDPRFAGLIEGVKVLSKKGKDSIENGKMV
ncbi:phosphotransferase family protein [Arcticibacterium luteifluviistationis]|uniref:Phosphotransferase family protein n=1 Tax=Arcticibacterium luteifluviistationis TaxID=1784714 RepID=A0A2Z4GCH8_9BACT|nr:phosphotransferase family protein [Arcticibacterium luteifluviistationis]AWV99002.1 phosphotransferase family protein [Arcticibacterium luteifluviistationis]